VIRPADAFDEGLEEQIGAFMGVGVVLDHGDLQGAQGLEEGGGDIPLVHQGHGTPGLEAPGQRGMQLLAEVVGLAGQGLLQEGVGAAAHPAGPVVPGDGDAGLSAQRAPGFLDGQGPGHMAQPKTQISVDAENQQGGHDPESLTVIEGDGEGAAPLPASWNA